MPHRSRASAAGMSPLACPAATSTSGTATNCGLPVRPRSRDPRRGRQAQRRRGQLDEAAADGDARPRPVADPAGQSAEGVHALRRPGCRGRQEQRGGGSRASGGGSRAIVRGGRSSWYPQQGVGGGDGHRGTAFLEMLLSAGIPHARSSSLTRRRADETHRHPDHQGRPTSGPDFVSAVGRSPPPRSRRGRPRRRHPDRGRDGSEPTVAGPAGPTRESRICDHREPVIPRRPSHVRDQRRARGEGAAAGAQHRLVGSTRSSR